jgi:magnesium-transporting ATPase (P-type)
MIYAASKRALREALVGIGLEIQGTDASEVAYETGETKLSISISIDCALLTSTCLLLVLEKALKR